MKRFESILFVCGGEADRAALERAGMVAREHQARLTLVDVVDSLTLQGETVGRGVPIEAVEQALHHEHRDYLDALAAQIEGVTVTTRLLSGTPFLEIVREVLRGGHDLVMKTAEGEHRLRERLFGSTDMHLLRKCPCPVWLSRPEEHEPYRRVLAAVDFDPSLGNGEVDRDAALNARIVDLAASIATAEFAELHVGHAWEAAGESALRSGRFQVGSDDVDTYVSAVERAHRERMEVLLTDATHRLGREAMDFLKPQSHLQKGPAHDVIPELVASLKPDVVVMGTVARTGIPGFLIGNTAESILGAIDCAVLAVKPPGFVTPVTPEA